jgi:ribosomal protein S18 acetylase RimI-like enzyme
MYVDAMAELPAVRRAGPDDVPVLAATLARAFYDDPVASWAFRADGVRLRALERFQAIRTRQLMPGEEIWMSEGGKCAALWAPPGAWRTTAREDAALTRCFMHPLLFARMPLVTAGFLGLEAKHPRDPQHYYLAVLGTDPDSQGQGLGSALMGPVLEQCDRDGVAAFLESSKESNIAFYARHGFRVTQELRLLRGPPMWQMWRDPR